MRILVVEDDARVSRFICRGLREEQYTVDLAEDGERALFLAQTNDYDLILLDVLLPKRNGLDVLKTLRAERVSVPVLLLTGQRSTEEKVAGLNAGADDYLPKPFEFDELLARVRALLRRRGDLIPTALRAGNLELDALHHRASRGGEPLTLTNREFAVLEFFLRHQGEVVTHTMLAEHVWEHDFDPLSNVINVTIARLRHKVDEGHASPLVTTIRGRGYMLQAPASSPRASAKKAKRATK